MLDDVSEWAKGVNWGGLGALNYDLLRMLLGQAGSGTLSDPAGAWSEFGSGALEGVAVIGDTVPSLWGQRPFAEQGWYDPSTRRADISLKCSIVGYSAGLAALGVWAAGADMWLGAVDWHVAHHPFIINGVRSMRPHLQFMLRVAARGKPLAKRIPLPSWLSPWRNLRLF